MDYSLIENREAFNSLYWASKPPEVRELEKLARLSPERKTAAGELAIRGYTIDVMIDAYGFEPWGTMDGRRIMGYKWSPSMFQKITLVMFPLNPWEVGPDTPMPAGAIKISFDPADYPPFDPPTPVEAPRADFVPVGPCVFNNVYQGNFGDNLPVGSTWNDSRGSFVKKSVASPFGQRVWWEKIA